ncbi:MAG: hypothetical protein DRP03_03300 [Candidatus Aenigmatarchaeota archaeon]|nr:MAG: hypothetical protein DRP03_03300 [Candidatus Aenigmarchaeota archaeon]
MHKPEISVIMATHNGEKYINKAIESVLSQDADFELIIIDDCSNDATPSIIKGYGDKRIRLLFNENNMGITKTYNRGIRECRGEFFTFVDHDDIIPSQSLGKRASVLKNNTNAVAVFGKSLRIDEEGRAYKVKGYPLSRKQGPIDKRVFESYMLFSPVSPWDHGSFMFRKAYVEELGYYDEELVVADWEFVLRCCRSDFDIEYLPEIVYHYRAHPNNFMRKYRRERHWVRDKRLAMAKHGLPSSLLYYRYFIESAKGICSRISYKR